MFKTQSINSNITDVGKFHEVLKYYHVNGYSSDLYVFFGKKTNGLNGEKSVRNNIIMLKKLDTVDVSPLIERHDWISGEIYSCEKNVVYNDDGTTAKPYYVRNNADQVFKCIWNNNGGVSSQEPNVNMTKVDIHSPYVMSDGYVWMYVTTIDVGQKHKFFDDNYMPIQPYSLFNSINPDDAGLGRIEYIHVVNPGKGYVNIPEVSIEGDGSKRAIARAIPVNKKIDHFVIDDAGCDYSYANVKISPPNDIENGEQAKAIAMISPIGGTGSNPCVELGCDTISLSVILEYENKEIPLNLQFNQIGIISKPQIIGKDGKSEYTSKDIIKSYMTIKYIQSLETTEYVVGDKIVQYGKSGDVVFEGVIANNRPDTSEVDVINTVGTPVIHTIATSIGDGNAGVSRVIESYTEPDFAKHTGNIIYVEDKETNIIHSEIGNEQFRITIKFK